MLNENEIRLVTAALVLLLMAAENENHPDVPAIRQLLLKLRQMRDAQAQG